MKKNLVLMSDSYKYTHHRQYPPNTQYVYSYLESRGGQYPTTTFFGLQYYLKEYLSGEVVKADDVLEAYTFCLQHFLDASLFNLKGWQHIVVEHKGRLPISIKAVPEGLTIPTSNVLMTIENTCPKCFWLTNFLETLLLKVWYPTTVCTLSREIKKVILKYLDVSGDPSTLNLRLHDFGYRGVSSEETAAIGGAAHLINFRGTDTIAGARMLMEYYQSKVPAALIEMPGHSIPAAEHSTITSWGESHEEDAYRNMLTQFPKGPVAVVSDSFDIYTACRHLWGHQLRDQVESRDGLLVVRPDSGDPAQVVTKVVQILAEQFGSETNEKGFEVLNPKVRVIQGDGVNINSIRAVLQNLQDHGFSSDNVSFGMGGALLQQVNRDTQKFAFKASNVVVDGKDRQIYKRPSLDKTKDSKRGRLMLTHLWEDRFVTTTIDPEKAYVGDILQEVFRNGTVLIDQSMQDIRKRAWRE